MDNKICIHRYLTKCKTNPQPPGIADFLRGTKTLHLLSQKFNYKLYIDYDSHPIFKYFKYNPNFYISNTDNIDTLEILPPLDYGVIYEKLEELFTNNDILYILTNSFYSSYGASGNYTNEEIINSNNFLKNILIPDILLENLYKKKLEDLNIKEDETFIIIHLRFNDDCFSNKSFYISDIHYNKIIEKINTIINTCIDKKIIIISNFYNLVKKLKDIYKEICFTNSNTIHLGLLSSENYEISIQETLLDLLFIINSSEIHAISQYGGSGFSYFISEIYNIKYNNYSNDIF
jgi:hypothetical protein